MRVNISLAENHLNARKRAKMTQRQESYLSGVSAATISDIESGKSVKPHFSTVVRLARTLKVTPGELFGDPKEDQFTSSTDGLLTSSSGAGEARRIADALERIADAMEEKL